MGELNAHFAASLAPVIPGDPPSLLLIRLLQIGPCSIFQNQGQIVRLPRVLEMLVVIRYP